MVETKGKRGASRSHSRTLAKHTPEREVTVKVDAGLKKRWTALLAIVHAAKSEEAKDFDRLWEAVGEIVDHDLHLIGGFKDAPDFFERELGESPRNAYRYIKVARYASPAEEDRYGITKVDAAIGFIEAKIGAPLAHPPLPIALDEVRVPITGGATASLDDARVEDVQAATRALLKKSAAPTTSAERAIKEALAKHPVFKDVHVRVRNGLVNVIGIPAASLGVFGTVLRETKWEAGSSRRVARRGQPKSAKKRG